MVKIMVVEDNDFNIKLFKVLLERAGFETRFVIDAETALEVLEKEEVPDLMILDIQLPGMSGIDLARELRKNSRYDKMKIVAVTAFSMAGDREKILAAGCNYYVAKPIDTRKFIPLLNDLLEGRKPSY